MCAQGCVIASVLDAPVREVSHSAVSTGSGYGMGRQPKQPNVQLAELLDEAGISNKGLARRVVERARDVGIELKYDHTSVSRWLGGEQPNRPGPNLIADVLAETVGRQVTAEECGMSGAGDVVDLGLEFSLKWSDGIDSALALWRSDVERRRFLEGAAYAIAVYPAATMRWLTIPSPEHPVSVGRRRVGIGDVEALRTMTAAFRDLDNKVGGGRVRVTVVQYLHSSVSLLLRGSYTEHTGKQLFSAAAEVTKLAGWMAYDEEEHGLAQRYLIQALRMARTAGDSGLGAEVLAAMSHQATYVGRPGDAVDLARAAQITSRRAGLGALESECHLVEAHGHAARHEGTACGLALNAAERAYTGDDSTRPDWLAYFNESYIAAKIAHCFRDLGDDRRTARYAARSLEMSEGYQRGKTFNLCLLASAHAEKEPLEAVRVGSQALVLARGLSSQRSHAYLRDLRSRLDRHSDLAEVGRFRQQVAEITAKG